MALIERRQRRVPEPRTVVHGPGLDVVVVDADPLVGVADGHVEREVVLEVGVVGEVELGEVGSVDVGLDLVGAEDEPEDEDDDAENDDDGDEELDQGAEAGAGAAGGTAANVVVGLRLRRDRRAVVGSVEG